MKKFSLILSLIVVLPVLTFTTFVMVAKGKSTEHFLHINNGTEPKSLDPHIATGVVESRILRSLYEGLTTLNQKTLKVEPGIAESWSISEDMKTYTFKIREAKWSNGDPITAHDFVKSWQRALRLSPVSKYVGILFVLDGAEEYAQKKHNDFSKVGVKALDDRTLEVTLGSPTPFFLELLDHYTFYPFHDPHRNHKVKDGFDIYEVDASLQNAKKLIGNGAFTLQYHIQNNRIIVEKNPNYYDADKVNLEGIVFYPINQSDTALLLFKNRELDFITDVPVDALPILIQNKDPHLVVDAYLGTYYFRFNTKKEPYSNVNFRKAICHAIDREVITRQVTQAGELPTTTMCPPGMSGYTPPKGLGYDLDKAKEYMKKAKSEVDIPADLEIKLHYNTHESHQKIALVIAQMLKKNLGLNVTLENKEWKVYQEDQSKLNYDFSRSGWIGDYSDPHTFLELMKSSDGNNRTGWGSEAFDNFVAQSFTAATVEERMKLLHKAEKILIEDEVPITPIYHYVSKTMVSPRVKGWTPNLRSLISFKNLYIEE